MTNQEAIEAIKLAQSQVEWDYPMDYAAAFDKAIEALEQEPRKGQWYRHTNDYVDYYECSKCGMAMSLYDIKHYCPNCGSRNEVEK